MNFQAYFIIKYYFHVHVHVNLNVNVNDHDCVNDCGRDHDGYHLFKVSGSQASFSKRFLTKMH